MFASEETEIDWKGLLLLDGVGTTVSESTGRGEAAPCGSETLVGTALFYPN